MTSEISFEEFAGGSAKPARSSSTDTSAISFEDFAGKPESPYAKVFDKTLSAAKAAGGEATALADLVLSLPGFMLNIGGQLGGTIQAGARGTPFTADPRALNPVTAYSVGRQAGQEFSEPFMNPLKKVLDLFKSGEAYEKSKTTEGMSWLTEQMEAGGKWAERVTGGRVSRDAVPMFLETLMAGATGIGSGKAQPAIRPDMAKRMRIEAERLRNQGEADLKAEQQTLPEQVARGDVQQQINSLLGIRTPAERARITRERRADINRAFRQPEEGSEFGSVEESQFRAEERLANTRDFTQHPEALEENARGGLGEGVEIPLPPRPERIGQAEILRIMQKPGYERTAEDLITLREARKQGGKMDPTVAALLTGAGIGALAGAELDDDHLRGAFLGAGTMGMPLAMMKALGAGGVKSRFKQAGAVKSPGGMWHPEAVERLANPLANAFRRNLNVEGQPGFPAYEENLLKAAEPTDKWADKAVRNYLNKYAGTERDPLKDVEIPYRNDTRMWGVAWDEAIGTLPAERFTKPDPISGTRENFAEALKAPPDEKVFGLKGNSIFRSVTNPATDALTQYLSHVGDYLRQNVKPEELQRYDLVRAVRETAANDARVAKEMEKAASASMKDMPVYKAYPDGFKWVELKLPEKLTEEQAKGVKREIVKEDRELEGGHIGDMPDFVKKGDEIWTAIGPDGKPVKNSYTGELAQAGSPEEAWLAGQLAQEGNVMGHCVGGYCPSVASGESRIFSLRDPKGKSHVTVEVNPPDVRAPHNSPEYFAKAQGGELLERWNQAQKEQTNYDAGPVIKINREIIQSSAYRKWLAERPQDVVQIKGKQNRAPNKEYLPYVQDFVRSGPVQQPKRLVRVGIGKGYEHQHAWIDRALEKHGLPRDLPVEDFDMRSFPEKGDVLDAIQPGDLVVGQHLSFKAKSDAPDYFYNKRNEDLLKVAHEKGADVLLLGEQPDGTNVPSGKLYKAPQKQWGEVGDLGNTGLVDFRTKRGSVDPFVVDRSKGSVYPEDVDLKPGLYTREELAKAYAEAGAEIDPRYAVPENIREIHRQNFRPRRERPDDDMSRGPRGERGFIDQQLVVGLTGLGLGGLVGWAMSDDPSGALLGGLAGASLALPGTRARLKRAAEMADYGLGSLSTRIGNISEPLKLRAREYERRNLTRSYETLSRVVPFMKEVNKLGDTQKAAFDRALLNGDAAAASEVIKGNQPLVAAWREVRNVLGELGNQLQGMGRFKTMLDDYFPRVVKDVEGLKAALDTPMRTRLEEALAAGDAAAVRNRGTPMTNIERSAIINREIQGFRRAKGYQPGYAKGRQVQDITEQLQQFYHTPEESLYAYIRGAVQDIELVKFFGRDLVQTEVGKQRYTNIEASIGNLVGREMQQGKITPDQVKQLTEMLQSRFGGGERSPNQLVQEVRNLGNIGLLGNIVSAATQLSDVAMSVYAQGLVPTIGAIAKQLSGREKITPRDFGLADHIAEEFVSTTATANWLNKIFKSSLFTGVDRFGKGTHLNAAIARGERMSRTPGGIEQLRKEYGAAFGEEFPALVRDFQDGKITERVRAYAFSELSDMQPISKMEMPQGYLDNPNGRLMYMLKTFMLKQMDVVRRDAYNEMKKGNVGKGIKNLTEYALVLGIAGATTDMIKDWLLGRDVHFGAGDVAENVLKTFGWGEYIRDMASKGQLGRVAASFIAPPYQIIEQVIQRDPKAVQYIPLVGKLFYSWELGGKEAAEIRQKKGTGEPLSPGAEDYRRQKREERKAKREAQQ